MSSSENLLQEYLDSRCLKLSLAPIPKAAVTILADNDVDPTILLEFDERGLEKMHLPFGTIKKLLLIISNDRAKSTSPPAAVATSKDDAAASGKPKNNNNNNNNSDEINAPVANADMCTRDGSSNYDAAETVPHFAQPPTVPGPREAAQVSFPDGTMENLDSLLQQFSQASTATEFTEVASQIQRAVCGVLGGPTVDYNRYLSIVTARIEAGPEIDEHTSGLVGSALTNIQARTPQEKKSFADDEKLLTLALERVAAAKKDDTKLAWISAAANAWVAGMRNAKNPRYNSAAGEGFAPFGPKFAPIVLELMKKENFDESVRKITGDDEGLRRLTMMWQWIVLSHTKECVKTQMMGEVIRPLFDFTALQALLGNGVTRAETQGTLELVIDVADSVAQLLISNDAIDVAAIADSINRCAEKCRSPTSINNLVDFLHRLYRHPPLRFQMDKHLRCDVIYEKMKQLPWRNFKADEIAEHFEEVHQRQLAESIKKCLAAIGASASSSLTRSLVQKKIDGNTLRRLTRKDIDESFKSLDFNIKKELENYIDRFATDSLNDPDCEGAITKPSQRSRVEEGTDKTPE